MKQYQESLKSNEDIKRLMNTILNLAK